MRANLSRRYAPSSFATLSQSSLRSFLVRYALSVVATLLLVQASLEAEGATPLAGTIPWFATLTRLASLDVS